ncbi:hypothetical protein BU16DRAFT_170527 [Lophium mytilinum]|uniref:Uncharacterized protein n=1 Tax=Lophium mytilinum TaxID=390894 RepID=A0A6A6QCI6_9PEZI|nr:hypothetical protein BU16DRAFT_170527 [Lophium mytilinum]
MFIRKPIFSYKEESYSKVVIESDKVTDRIEYSDQVKHQNRDGYQCGDKHRSRLKLPDYNEYLNDDVSLHRDKRSGCKKPANRDNRKHPYNDDYLYPNKYTDRDKSRNHVKLSDHDKYPDLDKHPNRIKHREPPPKFVRDSYHSFEPSERQ